MDALSEPIGRTSDPRILLDFHSTPRETPSNLLAPFSPAPSRAPRALFPSAKRQGASCLAEKQFEDQHCRLLIVLGDHLEKVGKTLSAYAAAENDVRNASRVLQPGTLRDLRSSLFSLISDDGHDIDEYANCTSDMWNEDPATRSKSNQTERQSSVVTNMKVPQMGACGNYIAKQEPLAPKKDTCDKAHEAAMPDPMDSQGFVADDSMAILNVHEVPTKRMPIPTNASKESHKSNLKSGPTYGSGDTLSPWKSRRVTLLFSTEYVVAAVILAYAIVLGMSVDIKWNGWDQVEYAFTAFFLLEVLFKLNLVGVNRYFLGEAWGWNWFDFAVVIVAIADIAVTLTRPSVTTDLRIFTTLKIIRLGRIARLIRLLRFKIFKELKTMALGVVSGLRVFFWAMVLFFAFIYVIALALRQTLGGIDDGSTDPLIRKAFESMPASMNTLFMCFTDGCTASNGTPLQVHFYDDQGILLVIFYMLTMLFVTVGLFNLIMATFVENVIEKGKKQKTERMAMERSLLEKRLKRTIKKYLESRECRLQSGLSPVKQRSSRFSIKKLMNLFGLAGRFITGRSVYFSSEQHYDRFEDMSITRDIFSDLLAEPDMMDTLINLEIETSNQDELFDILDADMSGSLEFNELVGGLLRLRGAAEKKDLIGSLLCIRSTQQYLREMNKSNKQLLQKVLDHLAQSTQETMS